MHTFIAQQPEDGQWAPSGTPSTRETPAGRAINRQDKDVADHKEGMSTIDHPVEPKW